MTAQPIQDLNDQTFLQAGFEALVNQSSLERSGANQTCLRGARDLIFTHLKMCLITMSHNFKWVKISPICLIRDQTLALI